jgi:predicted nucleic acid-binding protein
VIFLDTSALMKRYVDEPGTDAVLQAMNDDRDWAASSLARVETQVSLCHRGTQGAIDGPAVRRLANDWDRFNAVPIDAECLARARDIGCVQRVRTVDAIHLASALLLPTVTFVSFDRQQMEASRALGLEVLDV